jgi:hypothetical protein
MIPISNKAYNLRPVREAFLLMRLILISCLAMVIAPATLAQLQLSDFDVTNGKIEKAAGNRLMVNAREMRANLKVQTPQSVTLRFTYLGPTTEVARMASGAVFTQLGIKLRAQDFCNAVFVSWHFAPQQRISVSVRRNPGMAREGCVGKGNVNNITPRVFAPPPAIQPNEPHTLTASMDGSKLTVTADGKIVWQRDLGPVVLEFNGPVGLLSDNARVIFDVSAGK